MADPARMLFCNASYDAQLMRTLAAAMAGGADLGEVLATARRIGKPSRTAWYDAFAGYLAPRAACFEHRLAALVCDPAQPDMGARIPAGLAAVYRWLRNTLPHAPATMTGKEKEHVH